MILFKVYYDDKNEYCTYTLRRYVPRYFLLEDKKISASESRVDFHPTQKSKLETQNSTPTTTKCLFSRLE